MSSAAIIVAAGSARRFASKIPKQFLNLNGRPVYLWSVLAFKKIKEFRQIIVVVPQKYLSRLKPFEKKYGIEFAAGGKERYDSVMSGLKKVRQDIGFVAIHDAARPLITKDIIAECLRQAKRSGAAIVAVAAKDTVKKAGAGLIVQATIPRNTVWLAQTPQIFRKSLLEKAYAKKFSSPVIKWVNLVSRRVPQVGQCPASKLTALNGFKTCSRV